MAYDGYRCLRTKLDGGVAWVTIDHPPINLFDAALIGDMLRIGEELERDPAVRVVVLQSANPEFFIAHADVELIQKLPASAPPKPAKLGFFHAMVERMRTMPKATIAKLEGIARGGGSELALSCDMRFGALGRCVLAQPEVALGILPGGSGTQRLPRLVGRARALEIILGCEDVPADLAERWGYLNRALPAGGARPLRRRPRATDRVVPRRGHRPREARRRCGGRDGRRGPPRGGALLQPLPRDGSRAGANGRISRGRRPDSRGRAAAQSARGGAGKAMKRRACLVP